MPWVVPIGKTPRRTCMCWQCEQFRLYCATLKANAPAQMVTEEHPLAGDSSPLTQTAVGSGRQRRSGAVDL